MKRKFSGVSIPWLKILDRYIIGKFLSTYFFSIMLIIVIVVIFDYSEKIDDFTELNAPFRAIVMDYYLNFIPFFINQFSSLFTFVAVIFFTSKLAYQTEIVAMLSGGMSFRRLMLPYFIGAVIIAALSLSMNLWVIPTSQRSIVKFESQYIKRKQNKHFDRHIYRQISPENFVYIRAFSAYNSRASYFVLEQYDKGKIIRSLDAANATFDEETNRWTAPRYIMRDFDSLGVESFKQFRNLDTTINLSINELGRVEELVKTLKIDQLNEFFDQQVAKGSDELNTIAVERHIRFTYPFATFILTLIGVSLSSRKVRGGTGLHIGIGIALCFSYILINRVFEEFAKSGAMAVWLAVWLPNILYSIIGVYLYIKAPK